MSKKEDEKKGRWSGGAVGVLSEGGLRDLKEGIGGGNRVLKQ